MLIKINDLIKYIKTGALYIKIVDSHKIIFSMLNKYL